MSRHDGRRVWAEADDGFPCCGHPLAMHGPDGCLAGWDAEDAAVDESGPCGCGLKGYSARRRPC